MGILNPIQHEHPEVTQRWEERNADQPKALGEHSFDEFIMLGLGDFDAFIDFLEKQGARVVEQNASHPFQKRHYLVQAAMDDLKKHYEKVGKGPL